MTRAAAFAALRSLALALAGCWPGSEFKDETEELAYLQELSNPTPDQWKRREELKVKLAEEAFRRGPEPGMTFELPERVTALDVFDSLDGLRTAQALVRANKVSSPEWEANDRHRITALFAGEAVGVIEVGKDYVVLRAYNAKPRDGYEGSGSTQEVYASRWWDAAAPDEAVGIIQRSP